MKTLNRFISIAIFVLATIAIPTASFAYVSYNGALPVIMNLGVHTLSYNQATVEVNFNAENATYSFSQDPTMVVSYTDLETGASMTTSSNYETGLSETQTFFLNDLQPNTNYSYQAVLSFQGMTIESTPSTFKTPSNPGAVAAYNNSTAGGTIVESNSSIAPNYYNSNSISRVSSTQAANYFPIAIPTVTSVENAVGATAAKKAILNTIETGTTVHSNGVILAMTDDQATVTKGDTLTYTVTYRNTNPTRLQDAILQVQLPNQYAYISNGNQNASYDDTANTVTFGLGAIASGETNTVTFQAQATGTGSGTVITRGILSYDGGSVTATDHDSYNGGAVDILGASVFGAGFFPQTFGGWLAIVLIIAAIVIIARRYIIAPKPAQPAVAK